jgi:hypothetical protein
MSQICEQQTVTTNLNASGWKETMYGKIFESIYDGSLYGHWEAIVTMQQLIVLADADGVIDMTPPAIAGKTSIPIEILKKGLNILSEFDPYSRSPECNGIRIQLLDDQRPWGWFLVNHKKYKNLRTAQDRREYMQGYMRKRRQKESVNDPVNTSKQSLTQLANKDKYKEKEKDKPKMAPAVLTEFEDFKKVYPKRSGAQPWSRALKAIRARLNEGSQWADFLAGAERYAHYCDSVGRTGTEFVMQAATFCDSDKHFLESWEPPRTKSELLQDKNADAAHEWLDVSSE